MNPVSDSGAGKHRDFVGRVILISLLRVVHLVGVIGCGAAALGVMPLAESRSYLMLLVGAGISMVALDRWANPDYFRQFSGAAILLKAMLLAAIVFLGELSAGLFWVFLVGSVLLSHAPRRLRHRLLMPKQ